MGDLGSWAFYYGRGTQGQATPEAGDVSGDVIDNLLVRIHFIIEMIRWTGLAPWELEFSFPGSLTSSLKAGDATSGGQHASEPPSSEPNSKPQTQRLFN